jgi:EXLDI family protein
MPNKTIYVSDDDLPLFARAQELAGGSLSAAISSALRRWVQAEEGREQGYDDIVVKVGVGAGRKVRFTGVLLGEWGHTEGSQVEVHRVYRTRNGKFAVHTQRSPKLLGDSDTDWTRDWRSWLGLGISSWGLTQGERTLEVANSLQELAEKVPAELYEAVAAAADEPAVEDLDI